MTSFAIQRNPKTSFALGAYLCVAVAALVACGGGQEASTANGPQEALAGTGADTAPVATQPSNGARERAMSITATTPQTAGTWSAPFDTRIIAIHMALQPDGRVLYYGSMPDGTQSAYRQYAVWDPTLGTGVNSVTLFDNLTATDIFCSSQTVLPFDGRTVIVGGDLPDAGNSHNNNSNVFDYRDNKLTRTNNINRKRWYSSTTTLMNGDTYIQGGAEGEDRPEIRRADGRFDLLTGADTSALASAFPRNWVAPDGRVFGIDFNGNSYFVDTNGAGAVVHNAPLPNFQPPGEAAAAMYRPGRILSMTRASTAVSVVDITRGNPVVSATEAVSSARWHGVATVLPDGRVLATGGSGGFNDLPSANYIAEAWDPITGQWTLGAKYQNARLYHGTALLLPDARVLLAGGGAPGPMINTNGEVYTPSYLYNASGQLAARPTITSAPTVLEPGQVFNLQMAAAGVSRVTLVRFGSVSHSWNSDQRLLDLPFTLGSAPTQVTARLPSRATDTPPGFYMVFAFDANGVPSVAKVLRMNVPGARPATAPAMNDIADQAWSSGAVSLQPTMASTGGATLRYTASGLPRGLSIDATTGRISGIPVQPGNHYVTVSADNGQWTGSRSFMWKVDAAPIVLQPPVSPGPGLVSTPISFTASATGTGVLYTWDFGDGSAPTARSANPAVSHTYTKPGIYTVTVTAINSQGVPSTGSFLQAVGLRRTTDQPTQSSQMALTGNGQLLWVVNPDADTVSVISTTTRAKVAEVAVGKHPVSLAVAGTGQVWVSNERSATISVLDPSTYKVVQTIALPAASQPFGVSASAVGTTMYVALQGTGKLLRIDAAKPPSFLEVDVGPNVRHVSVKSDSGTVFVTRFITPLMKGESPTNTQANGTGGEVVALTASPFALLGSPTVLVPSTKPDFENQGRGVPNYLGAMAISPDGSQAFVPSKQDNIYRGTLRDGNNINFQNTVRAISSRIVMATRQEDVSGRLDHDNASMASAAAFDPTGVWLFVALETSREVAIVNAHNRSQIMRVDAGMAPQGLVVSPDGTQLYVHNFIDRTVGVYDLSPLLSKGQTRVPLLATVGTVAAEKLTAQVLRGKQLFYDARDPRLAADRYMSCASCHNDGGHDGRVWDLTGMGEGLRNTIPLRGRAGLGQGMLHWSSNFDEVQDFEGQIRGLAGGTGLMSDAEYNAGTRSQPLGDKKAGVSADLDALAAYLASLNTFERSPFRPSPSQLSADAALGKVVFADQGCGSCHSGTAFTKSGNVNGEDIGTLKPSSGKRLNGPLTAIDVPTLRDVWATAPYLHDGSASTLEAAITAHKGVNIQAADMAKLVAYVREIGSDEVSAPPPSNPNPGGQGLKGEYFKGIELSGNVVLTRTEAINFNWQAGGPDPAVGNDKFSARWTGSLLAPSTGTYRLRTVSDDGVRMWVNNNLVVDDWSWHADTIDEAPAMALTAGQLVDIRVEYFEDTQLATMRLEWMPPGATAWVAVPASQLFAPSANAGLKGEYFNTVNLTGPVVLQRTEVPNFDLRPGSPAPAVNVENFSVRWTGTLTAASASAGTYAFQTYSDDGVRLWVNGVLVIDNWTNHGPMADTSGNITLTAGQKVSVRMEFFQNTGWAVAQLRWKTPGSASFVTVPQNLLAPN